MLLAFTLFLGCSAESPATLMPESHVEMAAGKTYARVLVPAGFSPEGHDRVFLPYPANWGVIASSSGNSQPALPVVVLCDALAPGSTLEIKPVAMVQLDSAGTAIDIIIGTPVDTALQTVQIDGFVDLLTEHEPVRHILQTWFVNYRGFGTFVLKGWRDEQAAIRRLPQTNAE